MLLEFELVLLIVMIGTLLLCNMKLKMPLSISMIISSIAATLAAGEGIPIRHIFEGCFGILDSVILICCAMIFMQVVTEIGTISACGGIIIKKFHKKPAVLLLFMGILMMIPGMLTGTAVVSIIGVGSVMLPVLGLMGMPLVDIGAMFAVCGTLAMAAPPVNIPAMLVASSVDMKFSGFTGPLLFITVLATIFTIFWYGHRYLKAIDIDQLEGKVDFEIAKRYGISLYIPVVLVVGWIAAIRLLPGIFPDMGNAFIFLVGAAAGSVCGKRCNLVNTTLKAMDSAIPIVARMMAVGSFIQVFNYLGIRGYIVGNCIVLPTILLMLAATVILPIFGGISIYGAAMLLGSPIILATLTGNEIIIAAAISVLAILGEIMPPTAIATYFAGDLVGVPSNQVLKKVWIPCLFTMLLCFICMVFSNSFDFIVF